MTDFDELEFVIPAYTPETMPLNRLLEYLEQIADVLGVANDMHLVRIDPSSTKPVFRMHAPMAERARAAAAAVRIGQGTNRQRDAYGRIRCMVRQDGDSRPASLSDRTGVLLNFAPEEDNYAVVATVRQATTFDGELTRVGGIGDDSAIQMQDLGGQVYSGFSAPRAVAKSMASHLFEPLRVTGIGNWERTRGGDWLLSKMLIQTYVPLEDSPVEDVLLRLRAAKVIWPRNADELLRAERGATE